MTKFMTVLVLDDEALVALDIAELVRQYGHQVIGPFHTAGQAMEFLDGGRVDFAILDINLGRGETSDAVARRLVAQDTPFIFLTGYSASEETATEALTSLDSLAKPFDEARLRAILNEQAKRLGS